MPSISPSFRIGILGGESERHNFVCIGEMEATVTIGEAFSEWSHGDKELPLGDIIVRLYLR